MFAQIIIFIDGVQAARMKMEDTITVEVKPGSHTIFLNVFHGLAPSSTITFNIKSGETRTFLVSLAPVLRNLRIKSLVE